MVVVLGLIFSPLRPKGDDILGKGGKSSGMVSFIKAADSVSKTIESGGQRRAAALGCCDVSHPELIDFINAKLIDGEISHFNISVLVNEEFIRAVENDDAWTFKFKQKEYGKKPARDIWNLIVENMIKNGEPGLLNGTNLFKIIHIIMIM
jgi:Ribonucleotide reductase, alpha subunit